MVTCLGKSYHFLGKCFHFWGSIITLGWPQLTMSNPPNKSWQGSDPGPPFPFLAMPGFSRLLLRPPLPYMSCKRSHPTSRTRAVSRRSVHWRQMQFGQLWFQLAKKPFVSQLLLQLLSIKATICRFCMQDNHYLAFKGIPSSQQWICKI